MIFVYLINSCWVGAKVLKIINQEAHEIVMQAACWESCSEELQMLPPGHTSDTTGRLALSLSGHALLIFVYHIFSAVCLQAVGANKRINQ